MPLLTYLATQILGTMQRGPRSDHHSLVPAKRVRNLRARGACALRELREHSQAFLTRSGRASCASHLSPTACGFVLAPDRGWCSASRQRSPRHFRELGSAAGCHLRVWMAAGRPAAAIRRRGKRSHRARTIRIGTVLGILRVRQQNANYFRIFGVDMMGSIKGC